MINHTAVTFKIHYENTVSAEGGVSQEGPFVRSEGYSESGPNVIEQKAGCRPCVLVCHWRPNAINQYQTVTVQYRTNSHYKVHSAVFY